MMPIVLILSGSKRMMLDALGGVVLACSLGRHTRHIKLNSLLDLSKPPLEGNVDLKGVA
jgi:hypothetical protein